MASLTVLTACTNTSTQPVADSGDARAVGMGSAVVCTMVGPSNESPGVYGTDLGYTASPPGGDGPPVVLFGDTWGEAGDACRYVPRVNDDLVATVPAQLPSRLAEVDTAPRSCDLVSYGFTDESDVRSWTRVRLSSDAQASESDPSLAMGYLRTPVAAFTAIDGVYGVFHRNEPALCDASADCPGGMVCSAELPDVSLGMCAPVPGTPEGAAQAFCRNADDCMGTTCEIAGGMCLTQSPFEAVTPSGPVAPDWYLEDPRRGLARVMTIGRMDGPLPGDFTVVHRFPTNRFVNVAVRAVAHFDPENPENNDYRPGTETLLVWGRAQFAGRRDNQALPFFMFQRMPASPSDDWQWQPQFFAGLDAGGRPLWSSDEEDAQPIYGAQADAASGNGELVWQAPEFDNVNQMGVTWLEPFERWVMLYGGGAPGFLLLASEQQTVSVPQPHEGAIHMRHARHPWGALGRDVAGAWSAPEPLLTPAQAAPYMVCSGEQDMPGCLQNGDPDSLGDLIGTVVEHATELDPGAFVDVTGQCLEGQVAASVTQLSGEYVGSLYAPNVIDMWTRDRSNQGEVDVFWNVSTFNPYQVVLVRSPLRGEMLR